MKSNIKLMFAAGMMMLATGCTDLDVPLKSQYPSYPNSEVALNAQLNSIYSHFRGTLGRRFFEAMSLSSDEQTAVSYSGGWIDGGTYSHPSLHAFSYEDNTIDWMGELGKGCVKANEVINSDVDAKYKMPARAMRAYFEFLMMDCWGDAPILDVTVEGNDMNKRQPRAMVAKYLEKELLEIIPHLSTDASEGRNGIPNKYMAQALLAKLYINWPVYMAASVDKYDASSATNEKLDACISICDDIINSGKFNLGSMAYRFKFGPNNSALNVEDFIYAMPYDTYTATGMQYGRANSYKDIKSMNPSYFGMKLSNSGGGYMTMTPEFANLFTLAGDERNNCVIGGQVYVYDPTTLLPTTEVAKDRKGNPLILTKNITLRYTDVNHTTLDWQNLDVGDDLDGWRQGYRSVKFFVINDDYKNGRNQSNDVPIFRYADILLMKAEALTRKGTGGTVAQSLFNQIRTYVHAPSLTHVPTLQDIYEERGREFMNENWRRNDMIRFGHFEDEFFPHYHSNPYANFDKTRRIFPIHKDMLDNNTEWKQNPGYPDPRIK
ncbi:RagB/SusD family nutrient uptake outer membrane protein [Segatella salivae]|uniref:RagB/SusD family nutrient uptake outer membrane protein n=1 Tax=Segatella salivae TaxID=228604 RepID=UPI00248E8E83|nr:RagB/SusD family nutrient uptake outer membrane protein [Segatella salivae]